MRWRTYLQLGRVSNLPTVWTNVLAGAVLAGGAVSGRALLLPVLAGSLFYVGGMFLNDAFDREIDRRERPERPIPSGRVGTGEVFAVGYGMLTAGWLLLAAQVWGMGFGSARALLAGAALAAAIVVYNAWHKGNPFSPLVMGVCRALLYLTAGFAVAVTPGRAVLGGALALLAYLIGLTYVAKQETLARVANLWPLVFLAAPFAYAVPTNLASALLLATLLVWVLYALWLVVRRISIPRAVVSLIAGISLLDAALIAREGAQAAAVLAALGFVATLGLQRYVRGT